MYIHVLMKENGFLAVVLAALIAGSGGIYINNIGIDAKAIAWMRHTVPTLILGGILLTQGIRLFTGDRKAILWISFVSAIRILFFVLAYVYTSIGNAVVVFYTYPIFTLLFANRMLGEVISRRQIGLILLAFAGLIVIYSNKTFSFGNQDFLGMLFGLGASITFAYLVILMKKMNETYGRLEVLFYQNFLGVILFLPFFFLEWPQATFPDIGFGIVYGIVIGIVVYYLFLHGLKRMNASVASSLMYVEIPSTIVLGYIFLDEVLTVNFLLGAVMIVASSMLLRWKM